MRIVFLPFYFQCSKIVCRCITMQMFVFTLVVAMPRAKPDTEVQAMRLDCKLIGTVTRVYTWSYTLVFPSVSIQKSTHVSCVKKIFPYYQTSTWASKRGSVRIAEEVHLILIFHRCFTVEDLSCTGFVYLPHISELQSGHQNRLQARLWNNSHRRQDNSNDGGVFTVIERSWKEVEFIARRWDIINIKSKIMYWD